MTTPTKEFDFDVYFKVKGTTDSKVGHWLYAGRSWFSSHSSKKVGNYLEFMANATVSAISLKQAKTILVRDLRRRIKVPVTGIELDHKLRYQRKPTYIRVLGDILRK